MGLTDPYRQHNYMGEHASAAAVLVFVQNNKWDTNGDGSGEPRPGMMYYDTNLGLHMFWDSSRSKWLSFESLSLWFGRTGNTAVGSYYRGVGNKTFSATIGLYAFQAGTVIALGYTRSDTDAATFEVVSSGSQIATLASSAISGCSVSLDGDFTAAGILAVRNQTGGNAVKDVQGWFRIRWRAS